MSTTRASNTQRQGRSKARMGDDEATGGAWWQEYSQGMHGGTDRRAGLGMVEEGAALEKGVVKEAASGAFAVSHGQALGELPSRLKCFANCCV